MAVTSPGDALPCSLPQSNAEKLRAIGAKAPTAGVLPNSASKKPETSTGIAVDTRSVPSPSPSVGARLDLKV